MIDTAAKAQAKKDGTEPPAELDRQGCGFYALRHSCRTVADEARDFPAIDLIMGHADESTAARYRERISDERLMAVTDHVHRWLFGGAESPVEAELAKQAEIVREVATPAQVSSRVPD
ncbi:MAG: hypothetical protein MUF25_11175 [Pirellulaceae bacterium]|nr:hypothetical protein [Pirellulaceae bacterium]